MVSTPKTTYPVSVVILAAGKGTRMKSQRPKVLQPLAGRALLAHVLESATAQQPQKIFVVNGFAADQVNDFLAGPAQELASSVELTSVLQQSQNGTGHAVLQAAPLIPDKHIALILLGDVPLVSAADLAQLLCLCDNQNVALLTMSLDNPSGYGRIVRTSSNTVQAIVEHKDATPEQLAIHEVNSGIMAFPAIHLKSWLQGLKNDNAQGEYYLTDLISMAARDNVPIKTHCLPNSQAWRVTGVNTPLQLTSLERLWQKEQALQLLEKGVRISDPNRFELRAKNGSALAPELTCGCDVEIDVGCIFTGKVCLADNVQIHAYCHISNTAIESNTRVLPYSHIDGGNIAVEIGSNANVGPFARLRAGAKLADQVHIGNFVEIKNSSLGFGSKANHLAYLGDAHVGANVNYGAGCITANYDGAKKSKTIIKDGVHVGSNSVLVAPVTIGKDATIGAGSIIRKDAPSKFLTLTRSEVLVKENWQRAKKENI